MYQKSLVEKGCRPTPKPRTKEPLERKGEDPHRKVWVYFFASFYLPSFIEWQRCKGATDRRSDHFISVARIMPQKETQMEARRFA
tara:strand:+ start:969 stop:1223 length:255 start_codon:yes stop_codon:yes gene_type:complete